MSKPRGRILMLTLPVLVAALGSGGCGIFSMPRQLEENRLEIADLQRRQEALLRELDALRSLHEEQLALLRELRADQATQFDDLGQRVDALEQRIRFSGRELDRVARSLDSRPPAGTSTALQPTAVDTVRVPVVEGERLFDAAYSNLMHGRYPLAIMEFREYLDRFPDGDLADDCQYWTAESYYAQRELETAAQAYRGLVERYPDSPKIPTALLKSGLCYADLGDEERARRAFERVIEEHPYSDEAIQARDRLAKLIRP